LDGRGNLAQAPPCLTDTGRVEHVRQFRGRVLGPSVDRVGDRLTAAVAPVLGPGGCAGGIDLVEVLKEVAQRVCEKGLLRLIQCEW
jgi:hypothetical protein